jgi:hypothetical protein
MLTFPVLIKYPYGQARLLKDQKYSDEHKMKRFNAGRSRFCKYRVKWMDPSYLVFYYPFCPGQVWVNPSPKPGIAKIGTGQPGISLICKNLYTE